MKSQTRYEVFTSYALNQFLSIVAIFFAAVISWHLIKSAREIIFLGFNLQDPQLRLSLDFWSGIPISLGFCAIFIILANKLQREKLFYASIVLVYLPLLIGAMWLYPLRNSIQPAGEAIQKLRETYPYLQVLFIFYGRWIEVGLYAIMTLWMPLFVSLLPWLLANDITSLLKARFFYPLLMFLAGIPYLLGISLIDKLGPVTQESSSEMLKAFVVCAGVCLMLMVIFYWRYHRLHEKNSTFFPEQKPLRIPVIASFNQVFSHPTSRAIFFLIVGLSFIAELFMTLLFEQMNLVNIHKTTLSSINDTLNSWIGPMGKITIIYMIFAYIPLRQHRWKGLGLLAGISLLLMVLSIYVLTYTGYILKDQRAWGVPMGVLVVIFVLSILESLRQYWFVPLKEMLFMSLGAEHRFKSKAICDLVGLSLGVASAQMLISINRSIAGGDFFQALPYNIGFAMILAILWLKSITDLGPHMKKAESLQTQNS